MLGVGFNGVGCRSLLGELLFTIEITNLLILPMLLLTKQPLHHAHTLLLLERLLPPALIILNPLPSPDNPFNFLLLSKFLTKPPLSLHPLVFLLGCALIVLKEVVGGLLFLHVG